MAQDFELVLAQGVAHMLVLARQHGFQADELQAGCGPVGALMEHLRLCASAVECRGNGIGQRHVRVGQANELHERPADGTTQEGARTDIAGEQVAGRRIAIDLVDREAAPRKAVEVNTTRVHLQRVHDVVHECEQGGQLIGVGEPRDRLEIQLAGLVVEQVRHIGLHHDVGCRRTQAHGLPAPLTELSALVLLLGVHGRAVLVNDQAAVQGLAGLGDGHGEHHIAVVHHAAILAHPDAIASVAFSVRAVADIAGVGRDRLVVEQIGYRAVVGQGEDLADRVTQEAGLSRGAGDGEGRRHHGQRDVSKAEAEAVGHEGLLFDQFVQSVVMHHTQTRQATRPCQSRKIGGVNRPSRAGNGESNPCRSSDKLEPAPIVNQGLASA